MIECPICKHPEHREGDNRPNWCGGCRVCREFYRKPKKVKV